MTTPRNRRQTRTQPVPQRPHAGWGYGNKNARRRPQELALYRATELVFYLLRSGPAPRAKVLAHMRQHGIGVNTTHEAAALLGVPTNTQTGKPCVWELPENGKGLPHVWTALMHIEMHGRQLGKDARQARGEAMPEWRGRGKSGGDQNA